MDLDVRPATLATYAAFIASGIGLATWLARIPQIRDQLRLDPSELGLVLLAVSAGAVLALPLAGPLVARIGSRRTVAGTAVLFGAGLAVVAVGTTVGVAPVAAGLFVLGFATGGWDVAMNVQGTFVERALGRSIMPRFHAGFSLGTVAGSLVGAAMVAARRAGRRPPGRGGGPGGGRGAGGRPPLRGRPRRAGPRRAGPRRAGPRRAGPRRAGPRPGPPAGWGVRRVAGAADRAARLLRARLHLRRGGRQRLDQRGGDRRPRRPALGRDARLRRLPRRDDRRPVVRPCPARPVRPRPGRAGPGTRRRRGRGAVRIRTDPAGVRWAPCCGAPASRSGSRSA